MFFCGFLFICNYNIYIYIKYTFKQQCLHNVILAVKKEKTRIDNIKGKIHKNENIKFLNQIGYTYTYFNKKEELSIKEL